MNCEKLEKDLINWLKEYSKKANTKGIVYGLSGGIDSAVVAVIGKKAFNNNSLGIIMPINSLKTDMKDAILLAKAFDINYITIDLSENYENLISKFEKNKNEMAYANIKPRLRMIALYYYAQNNNLLVSGTTNLSEYTIGYSTKYGDAAVDISPLLDLTKTEVLEFAKYLGIPKKIIEKKPSAGLWEGQSDEDDFGFTYKELDNYILTGQGSEKLTKKVEYLKKINQHKKHMPEKFSYRGE